MTAWSTMAGLLDRAGFRILGDDLCAIGFDDRSPHVHAGIPRLKLWRDMPKFHVRLAETMKAAALAPLRLERVYLLGRRLCDDEPLIAPLQGAEAAGAVLDNAFRWAIGQAVAGEDSRSQFDQALNIARTASIFRVARRWGKKWLAEETSGIVDHLRSGV